MQSDMKEIRNSRKLEEMNVIDLFKSERLDVKSEEDCLSTEQQIEPEPAPASDQQDSKNNVRVFLHTHATNEYPPNSNSLSGKRIDSAKHSSHGINPASKAGKADFSTEQCNENTMNFRSTIMSSEKDQSISTPQTGLTMPAKCPNCSATCVGPTLKAEARQPSQEIETKEDVIIIENEAVEPTGIDLLKKYDFIKSYINKRYSEKYKELEKKLNEEPETVANPSNSLASEDETNPAGIGGISLKPLSNMLHNIEDDDVLILESDSDSQESILEVPISPKPQPPIVNLQDSDEETGFENCESAGTTDTTQKETSSQPIINNPECSGFDFQHNKQMRWIANSDDYINDFTEEDDIVLNCAGVQKGASSIKQIRDMSKLAENNQTCSSINNTNDGTGQFYIDTSRDDNQLRCLSSTNQQDLLMETAIQNTIVPKTGLLSYEHLQPLLGKKRPHENDHELPNSTKQKRRSLERDIEPSTSTENRFQDPRISNDGLQGQEHFDIHKILSKMSKDPRRWAILDEDLMPCPRRQRFWNVRCTTCQQDGHIRQNCPTPRKLPSCRICGIVGHTDTRCPDKMCLTVEELLSCGKKQGTFRKTCESCRILYCNMCKAIGHKLSGCPDLWRRFHQTTHQSKVNVPANPADVMKPANLLVCCNCTKRGHDSSTCREYRWSQHFVTPAFVSNYTDGPEYIYPLLENVEVNVRNTGCQNQEKNSTSKQQKTASAASEKSISITDCSRKEGKKTVLFSTGSYNVRHNKPHEITAKISKHSDRYKLAGLEEGRQKPKFLKTLLNIVNFKAKIVSNESGSLVLTVTANPEHTSKIYGLLRHWLQLEDRDKSASILTHLPMQRTIMLDLLETKLHELGEYFRPREVLTEIKETRARLCNVKDSAERSELEKKLFQLQCKLVRYYHTKPSVKNPIQEVYQVIRLLEKSKGDTINTGDYLRILLLYNKMFRPYMPPRLEEYFAKDKDDDIQHDLAKFEKFSRVIAEINQALAARKKEQIAIRRYSSNYSSSSAPFDQTILEAESKDETCTTEEPEQDRIITRNHARKVLLQTPTKLNSRPVLRSETERNKSPTPTPTNSTLVMPTQGENTSSNKGSQVPQPIEHSKNFPDTPDIRLQSSSPQSAKKSTPKSKKKSQTQSIDAANSEKEVKMNPAAENSEILPSTADARLHLDEPQNTTKQTPKSKKRNQTQSIDAANSEKETKMNPATENSEILPSTADAGLHLDEPQNTTKQTSKSKKRNQTQSIDSPSLEMEARQNLSAEHTEAFSCTADVGPRTNSPQSSTKQTSKNKKKIQPPSNETLDLETAAKELIQTALEFEVPYITKPAMDIERRLKDKSIEEKHITVLRKLIKLERKHQRKVNTVLMK